MDFQQRVVRLVSGIGWFVGIPVDDRSGGNKDPSPIHCQIRCFPAGTSCCYNIFNSKDPLTWTDGKAPPQGHSSVYPFGKDSPRIKMEGNFLPDDYTTDSR